MGSYRDNVATSIQDLKEVFEGASKSERIDIVKQAGYALAANIADHQEVDKFSAAATLYELCLIDTMAFFTLLRKGDSASMSAAEQFLAESPKMLAQVYAAIVLLSE